MKLLLSILLAVASTILAHGQPRQILNTDPETSPFLIQHGSKDPLKLYLKSTVFGNALYKVSGTQKASFELLEGAGRGGPQVSSPENLQKVFSFLDTHLKK